MSTLEFLDTIDKWKLTGQYNYVLALALIQTNGTVFVTKWLNFFKPSFGLLNSDSLITRYCVDRCVFQHTISFVSKIGIINWVGSHVSKVVLKCLFSQRKSDGNKTALVMEIFILLFVR